jgi:hypothetical protein
MLGMNRLAEKLRHAPRPASWLAERKMIGRGEKEKQMFLKSRKAMAAATLSIVIPLGAAASLPRKVVSAPQTVEFSLRSIDGQNVSAQSLRGEVVVLAFGASWLPLSRNQLQGIRKLADKYSAQGVVV